MGWHDYRGCIEHDGSISDIIELQAYKNHLAILSNQAESYKIYCISINTDLNKVDKDIGIIKDRDVLNKVICELKSCNKYQLIFVNGLLISCSDKVFSLIDDKKLLNFTDSINESIKNAICTITDLVKICLKINDNNNIDFKFNFGQ